MEVSQIAVMMIGSALAIVQGYFLHKIKKYTEEHEKQKNDERAVWMIMKEGFKTLLRDRIIQACRYYIQQGYTTDDALGNVSKMYELYHVGLKGNDVAHKYYEKFLSLPVKGENYL